MLRVRLLCAQLSYNTAVRQNLLQEKKISERLIESQRLLVEHGRAGTVELMQLELEMSLLDATIQRETLSREEVKHNLNKVMGASERPWDWELKDDAVELPPVAQSKGDLIKLALVSRPSIRATEILMETVAQKHNIAAREIWNFLVGISDKEFGESSASGWTISLGIDLPIFNQNEGGKAVAKAELEKALRTYEVQRNAIAHDIVAALQGLENSQAQLSRLEQAVVPAAVRYQEQVKQSVEIGREGQQGLLLAEQQLEKVKAARAQSVYQYQCAYYQLERAVAASLKAENKEYQVSD
jgi:cobalt-zinc-cadmium efflux system outer membrane protein